MEQSHKRRSKIKFLSSLAPDLTNVGFCLEEMVRLTKPPLTLARADEAIE